jgi:branched-chain amino acid transport system permease protein
MRPLSLALTAQRARDGTDALTRRRVLIAALFLGVFPWLMPYKALAINVLIYGLYAVGFNLLYGYLGMLSFGHAAFFGTGAYGCGIVVARWGKPWFLAIPAGVFSAAVVALAIGYLAIRTRGIYFAMVTLALAQCVYYVFFQAESLTGGENGLRGVNVRSISLPGVSLNLLRPTTKYYFILFFVVVALWIVSRILASPFGAVIEAIREREARARACGYNVAAFKLITFVVSGALCGLAGALNAIHLSTVPIESLVYETSGLAVIMSLLGGTGTFFGPFVGAAAFLLIQDLTALWTEHWQLIAGAVYMIFVLFFPRGIWGSVLEWLYR